MALEAFFQFKDKDDLYLVQDVDYEISQAFSNNYKPSGDPEGGLIRFTIISPDPTDLTFHEWAISKKDVRSGKFSLPITKDIKQYWRYMYFKDAYCIGLRECYSNSSGLQLYMNITICASYINWGQTEGGGVVFKNRGLIKD